MNHRRFWQSERGFTLPEVIIVVALLGIVLLIGTTSWLGVIEGNRVTSAANQLGADMRLAHTKATNQLATWRVVLVLDREDASQGPDYHLVKLDSAGNVVSSSARTLPGQVEVVTPSSVDSVLVRAVYTLLGLGSADTRTLEFKPDGSMDSLASDDPVDVTQDGDPVGRITYTETTSRIQIVS